MFKLTVISGPNRGTSYAVQDGELSIGRQTGNTIVLSSSKVSKRHCVLQVNGHEITVKDQGSSNGTFVNGILTKVKNVKPGDRISIGEFVFELSEPPKRSSNMAPAVAGLGNIGQIPNGGGRTPGFSQPAAMPGMGEALIQDDLPPNDLKGKILWYFEKKFMPIFYGMNLKYEWNIICIGMFVVFVVGNLMLSVYPILESSRATIIKEIGTRARYMARQISEQNSGFLASHNETRTEVGMVENADGVRLALLTDLDNRIIAPSAKMNQYLASGGEAAVAIRARDRFRSGQETGFWVESDSDTVVAIEPIKVMNPAVGKNVVVAMAIVSIDTSLATPALGEMGTIYSETLILTSILAGIILIILYRTTLKPFQVLNEDLDKVLKGDLPQVTHDFKLQELNPLWDIINSAIQRIPKSNGTSDGVLGGISGMGEGSQLSEEFLGPLKMLGNLVKFGIIVFDSEKKIIHINPMFEEISGIRSDGAIGHTMSEVGRDQSMGAFTEDILSRAPVGSEGVSEDYDFSGIAYKSYAMAFGPPGGGAKCYILAAVRVEG